MGFLDGPAAILFRTDASGQRVFTPFGPWAGVYRVSDADAASIQRHVKQFWLGAFVIIVGLQMSLGWRYNLVAVPVLLGCYFGMIALHLRHLPRLQLSPRELPSISRRELQLRYSRAIGAPTLAVLTVTSAAFTAVGIWMIAERAGADAWLVAGFFGLCTGSLFRQWRRARS